MSIPSHARVVVIGGGALGCSVLYHLVKLGWREVVLLERAELTSGSTWRAAGNTPHYSGSMVMSRVHQYSINLYQRLEHETGQAVGFHKCGSLRLANVPDRMDEYKYHRAKARYIGLPFEIVSPAEIRKLHPLVNTDGILGAVWNPDDGYVDPSMLTHALAQGARAGGAQIFRHTPVIGISARANGEWQIETAQGSIRAEHVVNAAGVWAREIGFMVGLALPIVALQHQYIVFDRVQEVAALGQIPILREVDVSYYMRQEVDGLLVGPYEKNARTFGAYGIPKEFGADPLPTDIERLQPILRGAMHRVPVLAHARIKRIVNGPITYTPDESPLLGPASGVKNFWLACGFSFGITQAGGSGMLLAEYIVNSAPRAPRRAARESSGIVRDDVRPFDMLENDPRRYGAYATLPYAMERCVDSYEHEYVIGYPYDERGAGRPARTSMLYDRLKTRGAFFNTRNGWERAAWFAEQGERATEHYSFHRTNAFPAIAREVKRVRENVGILDMTSFSKYMLSGRDARALLDELVANRLPNVDGGIALCHALNERGGVIAEMTITRLAHDRYFVVSAAAAELRDYDLLKHAIRAGQEVRVDNLTARWGALSVAGPKSRELLQRVIHHDLSNRAFPWRTARWFEIGAARGLALRLSYAGELGWELFHPLETQLGLYERLLNAGENLGVGDYGFRALDAMRLEKGFRAWGSELLIEITPLEAGLERFIAFHKNFIGRDALLQQKQNGIQHRIMTLTVDARDTDCRGSEPVFRNGKLVGITTSGGYAHTFGTSLALADLEIEHTARGTELQIEIWGEMINARVMEDCLYDAENEKPRA